MHIAFDVLPLIGCRMTGIGYCEAGQIQALSKMYPDDEFLLQFFSRKNEEIKIQRLQPYLRENVQPHWAKASGYVYRLVSNFLPISYRHYFGDKAEVTHFSTISFRPRWQERPWSLSTTWCTRRFRKRFAAERGICWIPD
ncbi:MAG: hypothetical protein ACLR1R_13695 [Ruminococcus callidus]